MSVRYRKNGKIVSGYKLEKADGTIVLNAPEEMWIEEGWQKVEQPVAIEPGYGSTSLEEFKQNILSECENFYTSVILKVSFNGELVWIPFADRVAYKSYLEDLKDAGIEHYNWEGVDLTIDQALMILKQINIFDYQTNEVYLNHVKNIKQLSSISELESYDYTEGYPEGISL